MIAIVVPSLKLLDSITWFPVLTGTSNTIPETVALISVFAAAPIPLVVPVFTIS